MDWNDAWIAMSRLAVAAMLGALIGLEREHHGRSAGLRTQILVALGAALAMVVSLHFADQFGQGDKGPAIQVDPARVAYGVMAGIGFLGAGAIIRYGIGIRGLTTAASLWCTAAVGLAAGFGMYVVALAATVIVLFTLYVLTFIDRIIPTRQYKKVVVKIPAGEDPDANLQRIRALLRDRGARVLNVDYMRNFETDTETISFHVALLSQAQVGSILTVAGEIPGLMSFQLL